MNKWIGIGRLCSDVEVRTSQNGTNIAKYRLAVNRQFKKEGQPDADFLNCIAFGKSADFAVKYLHKGMKIVVEGSIQTGSYDKDGVKHYTTDILVERMEFCESKNAGSDSYEREERAAIRDEMNGSFTAVEDNELPF